MRRSFLLINMLLIATVLCSAYSQKYDPVFMKRADLEKSVFFQSTPRELKSPGKIYVSGQMLYINERYKGIHIVDNSNPASPKKLGFIVAPGCIDIAVKDDMAYIDNAVDLVTFSLTEQKEVSRIKNFLPEPICPSGGTYYYNRPDDFIIVAWEIANN